MELGGSLKKFLISPAPAVVNTEQSTLHPYQPRLQEKREHEFVANWTSDQTKVMLDLYKKYRPKVGSFQIKNLKRLWEVLAAEMNEILESNYSSSHVENRWRVVERSYKKFVDNQTKTGRGKKYFEYQEEMDNIFRGKKNVKPDVLLSTDTIEHVEEVEPANEEPIQSTSNSATATFQTLGKGLSLKRRNPATTKNLTLEQLRRDRKEYYKERIEVEKQKLEVEKQKVVLMKERNNLFRERNELLKRDSN
nr:uncharacterized protein LOC111512571 [Leptinotarsa decemlineata]